jgi:hypothetical protein
MYIPMTTKATMAETDIPTSSFTNAVLISNPFLLEGFLLYVHSHLTTLQNRVPIW